MIKDEMKKKYSSNENLSDEEIIERLASDEYWCEGKIHPSINRLYHDIICPLECKSYNKNDGFCYCEECFYDVVVCTPYKQAMHRFRAKNIV